MFASCHHLERQRRLDCCAALVWWTAGVSNGEGYLLTFQFSNYILIQIFRNRHLAPSWPISFVRLLNEWWGLPALSPVALPLHFNRRRLRHEVLLRLLGIEAHHNLIAQVSYRFVPLFLLLGKLRFQIQVHWMESLLKMLAVLFKLLRKLVKVRV